MLRDCNALRNRGMFSRATLRFALANTSKSRAPKPLLCSALISKPHKAGCYVAQEHSVCYAVFAGITKLTTQSVDLRWLRLLMRKSFCYCYCEPQAPFPGRGCGGWDRYGRLSRQLPNEKSQPVSWLASFGSWRLPTLPHGVAVPSALVSLTSLFGMGRGGSSPL